MDRSRIAKLVAALLLAAALAWCTLGRGDLSVARVGPKPSPGGQVVVLLHGYGAPGNDLVDVAEEAARGRPDVTFLVPEGPHGVDGGGRSWLPSFSAATRDQYVARLGAETAATLAQLRKVIDAARRRGAACKDITVGGFSQGGRIAAELALTAPADCALGGVIVMSGGGARDLALPPASGQPRLRVMVSHGRRDSVVRFEEGEATARHFAAGGHDVRVVWFDGPHRIAPEVRAAIPRFLAGERVGEPVGANDER